jgi:hypothetical protein
MPADVVYASTAALTHDGIGTATLANEIGNHPMLLTLLHRLQSKGEQFAPA